MNLISVKETGYSIYPVYNTFTRLRKVIECIRDEEEIISFKENEDLINRKLELLINDDNKHLLSALFLIYIVCQSIAYRIPGERIWEKSLKIIEKVCSNNLDEVVYCYAGLPRFFLEENDKVVYPSEKWFYNEDNHNFEYIIKEVLKLDDELRLLLEKYSTIINDVIRKEYEDRMDIRKNIITVLHVIASYCIVNKEYDKFDELTNSVLNNVEEISSKVAMNGLRDQLAMKKIVNGNPYAEQCVEFVLDVVNSNDKRTIK